MLTAKRLRKVLGYAPTTGIFRWKVSASGRAPVGAIAGAKNGRGYHQIRIGGRPYSASRLAWLYMTGKWPNSEISYINGKPSDTDGQTFGSTIIAKSQSPYEEIAKAVAAGTPKADIPSRLRPEADIGATQSEHSLERPRKRTARTRRSTALHFALSSLFRTGTLVGKNTRKIDP